MKQIPLINKKIITERLIPFGFSYLDNVYSYKSEILGGRFLLELYVLKGEELWTRLSEKATNEEYVLHLISKAIGEFIGSIREAYNAAIENFINNCCATEIFKGEQTKLVIEYIKRTYDDEPEYLWKKFPNNAIFRRKDTKTWYAALLTVKEKKIGLLGEENLEILDLRIEPERLSSLLDYHNYFPAYHMNKKNWFTVLLNGTVKNEEIYSYIDNSYRLTLKR